MLIALLGKASPRCVAVIVLPLASLTMALASQAACARAAHDAQPTREDYVRALAAIRSLTAKVESLQSEVAEIKDDRSSPSAGNAASVGGTAPEQAADSSKPPMQNEAPDMAMAHAMAAESTSGPHYRGLTVTPTGFFELADIYRSHALGNDLFSNFGAVPFVSNRPGRESENRFSARSSRIGVLLEGDPGSDSHLSGVFEIDFLGAAQTANSVESNAWTPRARHLYAAVDWKRTGWHALAGQTWSLTVLDGSGIRPRSELVPATIDAQLVPGFVWTRQPQLRLTKNFGSSLWLAASIENPQTTFAGAVPAGVVSQLPNGSGYYAGAVNGAVPASAGGAGTPAATAATSSLNHLPDVVVKAAFDTQVTDHPVHVEMFGLGRAFTDRIGSSARNVYSGGVGGGAIIGLVPHRLDVMGTFFTGRGIGRYGTSLLPDVTFKPSGEIAPIPETDWLVGLTGHVADSLDLYLYAGQERERRRSFAGIYGYGVPGVDLGGCLIEGGSCAAVTGSVMQVTGGMWKTLFQGRTGRAQLGVQYSHTERRALSGLNALAPVGREDMLLTSLRYYPF